MSMDNLIDQFDKDDMREIFQAFLVSLSRALYTQPPPFSNADALLQQLSQEFEAEAIHRNLASDHRAYLELALDFVDSYIEHLDSLDS